MDLLKVPSTRVSSAEASRRTVKRCSSEMSSIQEVISGGATAVQLQDEVAILTDTE